VCGIKLRGGGRHIQEKGEGLAGGKHQTGGQDYRGWGGTQVS